MFDLQRVHHTGLVVADIAAAQSSIGAALNLQWSPVQTVELNL